MIAGQRCKRMAAHAFIVHVCICILQPDAQSLRLRTSEAICEYTSSDAGVRWCMASHAPL